MIRKQKNKTHKNITEDGSRLHANAEPLYVRDEQLWIWAPLGGPATNPWQIPRDGGTWYRIRHILHGVCL